MNEELLTLGAESEIFRLHRWGLDLVRKRRPKKPYLLESIDENLRNTRISRECKMLTIARTLGVPTPSVYAINYEDKSIIMDYIEGEQLKTIVPLINDDERESLCKMFGQYLAKLHLGDVVHGDPTTSNLIVDKKGRIWMIDFGLAEMNATLEMKGVDLHLVHRALETTHWNYQDSMLNAVLNGYSNVIGNEAEEIFERMKEIRERGRYH